MKRYIIPIFIPHYGCPHQCVFCDQRSITGVRKPVTADDVAETIAWHLGRIDRPRLVEVAFYGGSFTALPASQQTDLLKPAKKALDEDKIQAIRCSTRPDAIDEQKVRKLLTYGVSTVELGVQSLDNAVLQAAGRGHLVSDVLQAVAELKRFNVTCGLQLMPGLPTETWPSLIRTAKLVVSLAPAFVRIYPTVVIAGTELAAMWQRHEYQPLRLTEAVTRAAYLKLHFQQNGIDVIRVGLQATEELGPGGAVLDGPYHPAFGEMVDAELFYLMLAKFVEQSEPKRTTSLIVHHHPKDHSKLRGIANNNLSRLQNNYNIKIAAFKPDWPSRDEIAIENGGMTHVVNVTMFSCCI